MPSIRSYLLPAALAAILSACVLGFFATRDAAPLRGADTIRRNSQTGLMDDRLLKTAQTLARLADTPDGQASSKEALRLAGRDLDQAYATALREALSQPPPKSGPLKQLTDHIARLKSHIEAEQAQIDQLTKEAAKNDDAADRLDVAKAQLELDQDELADNQQDLAKQGGDRHALLEQEMQAHEAAVKEPVQYPKQETAQSSTLYEEFQQWRTLTDRVDQLGAAQQQAASKAATLEKQHDDFEKRMSGQQPTSDDDTVEQLYKLSNQRKTLIELDKRIQDLRQLANVYQRWGAQVETRRVGALHSALGSLAAILGVLLGVVIVDLLIRYKLGGEADRRRRRQLRVIGTLAVQVVGALVIVLIIFGMPTQTSTLIGLATAGITVVLRDFIVSFFGWFVLMGKNGIHVGDWVEIEGVGGEVIEIGVLRTMLLEVGNWTDRGHPTGRNVAFSNKFAIEGHYFNFSTSDQWLWDELIVSLPGSGDPYKLAQRILETVQRETETDAGLAEKDWQRATHKYGTRPFSAKPAVDLRPAAGQSLDVHVRYITRAPQRYEVKSKLFESIVELLHTTTAEETVK
jgi:small-conductance mechanosensitive channel